MALCGPWPWCGSAGGARLGLSRTAAPGRQGCGRGCLVCPRYGLEVGLWPRVTSSGGKSCLAVVPLRESEAFVPFPASPVLQQKLTSSASCLWWCVAAFSRKLHFWDTCFLGWVWGIAFLWDGCQRSPGRGLSRNLQISLGLLISVGA